MDVTPKKTGQKIDQVIDSLNAKWDLQLPRLHGADATEEASRGSFAKRCSSRIRYLCFRTENIDSILADYEARARTIYTQWVLKPSQEPGTLPILPVTKSFLSRDIHSKREAGIAQVTPTQRGQLQKLLFKILDEEYNLALISNSYSLERASDSSFCTAPELPTVASSSSEEFRADEPQLKDPMMKTSKRSLGSPNMVSSSRLNTT